jgi:hypothetical protein
LKKLAIRVSSKPAIKSVLRALGSNQKLCLTHFKLFWAYSNSDKLSSLEDKEQNILFDLFHRQSLVVFDWVAPVFPVASSELFEQIASCPTLKACAFSEVTLGPDGSELVTKFAEECKLEYFVCGNIKKVQNQNIFEQW